METIQRHQPVIEKGMQNPQIKRAVIGVNRMMRRAEELEAQAFRMEDKGADMARRAALVRDQAEQLDRIVQRKLKRRQ